MPVALRTLEYLENVLLTQDEASTDKTVPMRSRIIVGSKKP
jgi:hypothetical protein